MSGPTCGADALADSPLVGRLLEEWAPVFDAKVLPLLDPTTLAVFGRVGEACRDAVLRSPELPCAGRTVGAEFRVEEFVESVKLLAWAKDNGCRWDEHTFAAVAKGPLLPSPRADAWMCCSGRGSTIARGMGGHARPPLCSGRGRTGARGIRTRSTRCAARGVP
jgi:hypothetical protein